MHTCQVTLDIFGSPIDFQWADVYNLYDPCFQNISMWNPVIEDNEQFIL